MTRTRTRSVRHVRAPYRSCLPNACSKVVDAEWSGRRLAIGKLKQPLHN